MLLYGNDTIVSPYSDPDLVVIAVKIPDAVVCLVSALAVHGLTTQISRFVHIAIPRSVRYPKLEYPPLKVYRFSENSYASGIEKLDIGNVPAFSCGGSIYDYSG